MTVDDHFRLYGLNKASILELGLAILSQLELIHKAGYTYNNMKLENIMIGFRSRVLKHQSDKSAFKKASLTLIDFG